MDNNNVSSDVSSTASTSGSTVVSGAWALTLNRKRSHSDFKDKPKRPKTRIYVAGCNAWKNLNLNDKLIAHVEHIGDEDIYAFLLAEEGDCISQLRAYLERTIYTIDGSRKIVGELPDDFADQYLRNYVAAGDGMVVRVDPEKPNKIEKWSSIEHFRKQKHHGVEIHRPQRGHSNTHRNICQIAAWDCGFVLMDTDRRVYTFGDERFPDCLGRQADHSEPSFHRPVMVLGLPDPIDKAKKVVAGGYTVGVLTEMGHLYAWGMSNPGSNRIEQPFPDLQPFPNYEPVGKDEDLIDVALGERHAVALTAKREVFVRGSNTNGQLGLGWYDSDKRASEWTKVELELGDYQVEAVYAGPESTFLIARLQEEPEAESSDEESRDEKPSRKKRPEAEPEEGDYEEMDIVGE